MDVYYKWSIELGIIKGIRKERFKLSSGEFGVGRCGMYINYD